MREKKLTDEEVIEALECCGSEEDCLSCPYHKKNMLCYYTRCSDTLDLIHRLQAENEELREKLIGEQFAVDKWMEENAEQKAEIARLSLKVWNYENPVTAPINYAGMVHCSIADCYKENYELRTKNTELQKQMDELKANQIIECHGMLKGCDIVKQAVKDTAKEIEDKIQELLNTPFEGKTEKQEYQRKGMEEGLKMALEIVRECKGVEAE